MKQFLLFLSVIFLLSFSTRTNAQGKFGVFVGVGTMFYSGDLQDSFVAHPLTLRWTVDAGIHWQINRRWGLQLNYTVGEIVGDVALSSSEGKSSKGFRFESMLHEIGLRGTYDILRNDKWKFLPYITAGVSALNFEPMRDGVALRSLSTEGVSYSDWTVSFPTGMGLKYQINCQWALKGEIIYHWTLTDYLDDVSGAYPNPTGDADADFYSDPGGVSPPRKMRGNPNLKDGFWDVNVGVIFFFTGCGKGKKGGLIEDCDRLYQDVDMDKLKEKYR